MIAENMIVENMIVHHVHGHKTFMWGPATKMLAIILRLSILVSCYGSYTRFLLPHTDKPFRLRP